jgi:hypothetical protein
VFSAHGGRLFRGARVFVALKTANAVATMERTIRLQAKLMPRRKILAIRTRTLTFYSMLDMAEEPIAGCTYQILGLLLIGRCFMLLELLLFSEGRAQDARSSWCPWWCARRLHCTLEGTLCPGRWRGEVSPVGFFHLDCCYVG